MPVKRHSADPQRWLPLEKNKKIALKKIILLILILKIPLLRAQEVSHILEPILIENQTIEELRINGKIIDEIRFEGKLIHLEIQRNKGTFEYFKTKDSLYFFRHFSDGKLFNKGYYKISEQIRKIDSVFTFHPETYEEKLFVTSYNFVKKHGDWTETLNDSIHWKGKYDEGRKTGRWFKSTDKINFYKYGEYLRGELLMIYNPNTIDLKQNINWIINKAYTLCMISYNQDEENSEIENWWLGIDNDSFCQDFGKVIFMEKGDFEYSHNFQYQMDIKKYHGQGIWKINQEGYLILEFKNNDELVFVVEILSENKLRIKRKKR